MPTFGSLFAGIGGIDLGLERAGWTGRWQVEYDPYCTRVLAKHWPDVARYGDIHDVHGAAFCPVADATGADAGSGTEQFEGQEPPDGQSSQLLPDASGGGRAAVTGGHCRNCLPPVDLIAGGFPCQPFSNAGKRQGKDDIRWLWPEFARVIGDLRPRYVLVENVPGLLAGHGGMGAVLSDLAALGYDAEWDSIPASAVGAPHLRYRVWIVAYADGVGPGREAEVGPPGFAGARPEGAGAEPDGAGDRARPSGDWWLTEPDVGRVAHGVPARVDRLRALGNAVVPQVVEWIGRRIIEAEGLGA